MQNTYATNLNMNTINPDFEFFQSQLPELMKEHAGQFVVIKDQKIQGYYPTVEAALKSAYEKFGDADFIIQEVTREKMSTLRPSNNKKNSPLFELFKEFFILKIIMSSVIYFLAAVGLVLISLLSKWILVYIFHFTF